VKRKTIGTCVLVGFYLMLIATWQNPIAIAAPAIAETTTTLHILPTSLNFGSVTIGGESPGKTVHLRNVGTTPLVIIGITLAGTDPRDFSQTNNCKSSLAAGAICQVIIRFRPTASGTRRAALKIRHNGAGSPQLVPLSGVGIGGRCIPAHMQCLPNIPCCPGLVCIPASTRAFCEPRAQTLQGPIRSREYESLLKVDLEVSK